MHRHLTADVEGPLIRIDEARIVSDRDVTAGEGPAHSHGLPGIDGRNIVSGVGEDEARAAAGAQPIHRPAFKRAQREPRRVPSAAGGETRTNAGLRAGNRASRSIGSSTGIRAYIITMPDKNQTMKSRPPAMPSQRWV